MTGSRQHALLILRYVVEGGPLGTDYHPDDLRHKLGLSDSEFDGADTYLLQSGYLDGTAGGDSGRRWVTSSGVDFVEAEMRDRVRVTLAAERVLGVIIRKEEDARKAYVQAQTICETLEITEQQYLEAAQELSDEGLIESAARIGQAPYLLVRARSEGRRMYRRGFRKDTSASTPALNVGAIINSVQGGTVQAIGLADGSTISQAVNDPAMLSSQFDQLTGRLLDEVKEELGGLDLEQYERTLAILRQEILSVQPRESKMKGLFRTLAFFGDVEGSIGLMLRVAPYITQLVALGAALLQR